MNLLWQNSCFLVLSVNSPVIKSDAGVHRQYISIPVSFYIRSYILLSSVKPPSLPTVYEAIWWLSVTFAPSTFLQRKKSAVQHVVLLHTRYIRTAAAAGVCCGQQWPVLGRAQGMERMSLPHPLGGRDLLSASWCFSSTSPNEPKFHRILAISYQLTAMFS